MRRKRFQKGSFQARKHGRHRVLVAVIGRMASVGPKYWGVILKCQEAKPKQFFQRSCAPDQQGDNPDGEASVHTRAVRERSVPAFLPSELEDSTESTSQQIVKTHVVQELRNCLLQSITGSSCSILLDQKAFELSSSVVSHVRWFLNAIFKLALSDGVLLSNPAAEVRIPRKCRPGRTMQPLTGEEVSKYLGVLDLREKLIARLATFEGLRPGEILALRWRALDGDTLRVQERVYKRNLNTPKNGKAREPAISNGTLSLFKQWARVAEDPRQMALFLPPNG